MLVVILFGRTQPEERRKLCAVAAERDLAEGAAAGVVRIEGEPLVAAAAVAMQPQAIILITITSPLSKTMLQSHLCLPWAVPVPGGELATTWTSADSATTEMIPSLP